MKAGPFPGFNFNLDLTQLVLTPGALSLSIPDGGTQECTGFDGRDVDMSVSFGVPPGGAIDVILWLLDGAPVATGESVTIPVALGTHTVRVEASTVNGLNRAVEASLTIADTTSPVLDAGFVDAKSGQPVSTISDKDDAQVSISVSDVCDPAPVITSATAGLPVSDGDKVNVAQKGQADPELTLKGNAGYVEISVSVSDASGNTSSTTATLTVVP